MKGLGIVVSLVTLGVAGLLIYDVMFSKRCHHLIPIFDMLDTYCLVPGVLGGGGPQFGQQIGLVMDPTKVGQWLRSIQGSADTRFNKAAGDVLSYSQKTGRQAIRPYTSPPEVTAGPKSPGRSQAIRPGTSTPTPRGVSGAPQITPRGGASPFSFENFMGGLRSLFNLQGTQKWFNEYQKYLSRGGGLNYEDWFKWERTGLRTGRIGGGTIRVK